MCILEAQTQDSILDLREPVVACYHICVCIGEMVARHI